MVQVEITLDVDALATRICEAVKHDMAKVEAAILDAAKRKVLGQNAAMLPACDAPTLVPATGECHCWRRGPTYPVYRSEPHLPDCPLYAKGVPCR